MKKNTQRPAKGLNTDHSPKDQPKDTYRFAMNAVGESEEGDLSFLSTEESNEECATYPAGYIPLGKEYIGNGESAVLLVSQDESLSEIGILNDNCEYTSHVNFDLGFRVSKQIDVTYRLRRGCERTIYFVDDLNPPRIFNFDKPEDFKTSGVFDPNKFNLFKTFNTTPEFNSIKVEEEGNLPAGSYNFAIQYLDEDLNPTEWITTSDTIIVFNDITSRPYQEIRGSTNAVTFYQEFGLTNKSIRLDLTNLDPSFTFYRIAIIEANNGSGQVSRVVFSQEISTSVDTYVYTGNNAFTEGTEEEIQQFNNVIYSARHIEQIENRLVLSDVKGKPINFCKLQKYASRIKADLALEEIILNNIDIINNPKRGNVHFEKVGYMPGEIYSFGIVYLFEDGTVSPVYHIPGRNPTYLSDMSDDNESTTNTYLAASGCLDEDYWGYDSQGESLAGELVRHHRFPLRSEANEPLVVKEVDTDSITVNCLYIDISGTVDGAYAGPDPVTYVVNYTVGGSPTSKNFTLDLTAYDPDIGVKDVLVECSIEEIIFTGVDELDNGSNPIDPALHTTLTYTGRVESSTTTTDDSIYKTNIFGISFSDIVKPSLEDTEGCPVIGYYIVRNERTESEKTILDNGIITPLIEEKRAGLSKFVAFGHLAPQTDDLKDDIFGITHPEHKFRGIEYRNTTKYLKQGEYVVDASGKNTSSEIVQDVQPGTSYDASVNTRRERDSDGFDLHVLTRNTPLNYAFVTESFAEDAEIIDTFYLSSLFSKSVDDSTSTRKEVFNVSADNKAGILQLDKTFSLPDIRTKYPYVTMKRELSDPYSAYRVLPYYKEVDNPSLFGIGNSSVTIFNGDSYISSMRLTSTSFYDLRLKERSVKTGIWNFVLGVVSIIAGVAIAVFSAGTATAAAIAVAGFGVSQIATGIKRSQMSKVYQDLYEQGLKDTIDDDDTDSEFSADPDDDEVQWFLDTMTNVWVESSVNMNWRMGNTIGLTDFLDAPDGYDESELNTYAIEKVTTVDSEADGGRTYQGYAKAEIYEVNDDYRRRDKQKIFFHLGIEYDCCSDCIEEFPHRNHYSEQAFQEELTDNYRVFLPNNYRDIEGETGVVTNTFRIQNNFYIQTEEAIWHLPQNIQERITGDIISFIGTGDFFSIPPRKIIDDDTGHSAGTQHKWSVTKTPHGVFFVSERQNMVFKFDGQSLKPISSIGEFSWFKNNTTVLLDRKYKDDNGRPYPYRDNPSNPFGTGFISTYDSRKERVIFTKKDLVLDSTITDTDSYEICIKDGEIIVFEDFDTIISTQEGLGWTFLGINDDCELEFCRMTTEEITVDILEVIPNNADIHVFFDTSGSFGTFLENCLQSINTAIDNWVVNFAAANPDWTGTVYKYEDTTEQWVNYASVIAATTYGGVTADKDIIIISFCNEANGIYHGTTLSTTIQTPTAQYNTDHTNFVTLFSQYNSVTGITYPIVFGTTAGTCGASGGGSLPASKEFLLHSIAAVWGDILSASEIAVELPLQNPGFTLSEWNQLLAALQASNSNPYPDPGLQDYGWVGKWDRATDAAGNVIDDAQFQEDIEKLLEGSQTTITVQVEVPLEECMTIAGTIVPSPVNLNASWTKSFSLKAGAWRSYHSYLPSFYIHTPNKFYSWVNGNDNLFKHNKRGDYGTFYGTTYPFIVDYCSVSNPLQPRLWESLEIHTEAFSYDSNTDEFFDERFVTFDEAIFYNSRQCSGLLSLIVKDEVLPETDYLSQQIVDPVAPNIIIDKDEKTWRVNDLLDYRNNLTIPMFSRNITDLQSTYFIDKVINSGAIDFTKDWKDLELFRDKYLQIRLIFTNLGNNKLIFNYSVELENISHR